MQFAKDSFYMTLRSRLEALTPDCRVIIDGESQPAILVAENEPVTSAESNPDCFYVSFGAATLVSDLAPLMSLAVTIAYRTRGTTDGGCDRGRALAALDSELLAACDPASTPQCDYTQNPAASLGTSVFWTAPKLGDVASEGAALSRAATLTLYFYPERRTA